MTRTRTSLSFTAGSATYWRTLISASHVWHSRRAGAAGSDEYRLANQPGIKLAEVIPGFAVHFNIPDLLTCFAPRRVLMVSATDDPFSHDVDQVAATAQALCVNLGRVARIDHNRYAGEHALIQERFAGIVRWLTQYVT